MITQQQISVVVPVFGGANTLESLVERTAGSLSGSTVEIILVDDASTPEVAGVARQLAEKLPHVRYLRLTRNSGQHAALLAGIRAVRFGTVVTLDDDLQNPPEEIPKLLERLGRGDVDVVYGYSPRTSHRWWRRAASSLTRRIIAQLLRTPSSLHLSPFRAFKTELRDAFAIETGPGVSLDVLLGWSTSRFTHVEVAHDERSDGESGYSVRRLVRFAFDTLTGYSTALLNVVTWLGIMATLLGIGILVWVLGRYFAAGTAVAGFPFLASSIAIFSGAQMLSLGIIGQYIGRMHVRIQGRPAYHVAEIVDGPINDSQATPVPRAPDGAAE